MLSGGKETPLLLFHYLLAEYRLSYHGGSERLQRICREAHVNPDKRYLILIDEINRANLAKVMTKRAVAKLAGTAAASKSKGK